MQWSINVGSITTLETFQRVISDIMNSVKREKFIWLHNGLGSTRICWLSTYKCVMSIESKFSWLLKSFFYHILTSFVAFFWSCKENDRSNYKALGLVVLTSTSNAESYKTQNFPGKFYCHFLSIFLDPGVTGSPSSCCLLHCFKVALTGCRVSHTRSGHTYFYMWSKSYKCYKQANKQIRVTFFT